MIILKLPHIHVPCVLSRVGRSQEHRRDRGGWRNGGAQNIFLKTIIMLSNVY